jgi:NitT/TauT family transport system substrate-binding protein
MQSRMIRFFTFLLAATAAFGVRAVRADDVVKVGVFQSISDAPIYIAAEKGYFAEQHLKVEVQKIDSSATVTTALASGDIDVSGGSPAASIYNAVRQGVPIRIVADKGSTQPGHGYFAFMVRKGLADKIKTPADLRGRTLAATGYFAGASNEVTIHHLLAPARVKESEVNIIATIAVDKGFAVVWKRADEVYPSQQYAALIYGPGITKRPDVATRFMIAYLKGVRFYNDALSGKVPRSDLIAILIKDTTVKNADLYDKMKLPGLDPSGRLNEAGMSEDMKFFVAEGRMKELVDIKKIVDTQYSEAAVAKLGEYK